MPVRTIFLTLTMLTLILAGCSTSNSTIPETSDQTSSSNSNFGSLFSINEIGLGPNDYVALTNFTDQPASLGGLFLCQDTKCFELPNVEVAPGAMARIAVGDGTGLDNVVSTGATIGELQPVNGEVALYVSKKVKDPGSIIMYLEWGSTPHGNTDNAIEAGLWIKGSYAPSSDKATRLFRTDGGLLVFEEK